MNFDTRTTIEYIVMADMHEHGHEYDGEVACCDSWQRAFTRYEEEKAANPNRHCWLIQRTTTEMLLAS